VSLFVRLAVSLPVSLLLLRLTGGVYIRISSKRPVRAPAVTVQAADRPISSFFKKFNSLTENVCRIFQRQISTS